MKRYKRADFPSSMRLSLVHSLHSFSTLLFLIHSFMSLNYPLQLHPHTGRRTVGQCGSFYEYLFVVLWTINGDFILRDRYFWALCTVLPSCTLVLTCCFCLWSWGSAGWSLTYLNLLASILALRPPTFPFFDLVTERCRTVPMARTFANKQKEPGMFRDNKTFWCRNGVSTIKHLNCNTSSVIF